MSGTIAPTKLAVVVGFELYRRGDTITDAAEIARVMASAFAPFARVMSYGTTTGGGSTGGTGTGAGGTGTGAGGVVTGVAGALSLNSAGILSPVVGTASNTLAAGNDPRIANAVQQASLFDANGVIRAALLPAGSGTSTGGTAGPAGFSLLSGNGVPANALGNNGDAYVVTGTTGAGDVYDKAAGVWTKRANASLRGPQGIQGIQGVAGAKGADGTTPAVVTPTAVTALNDSDAFFLGRGADAVSVTFGTLKGLLGSPAPTSGTAPVAPGAVTGLTAGTATASAVPLSWTAPTTGTAPVTYTVEYRIGTAAFTVAQSGITATSYTVSGLTASTVYEFRVTATNSAGSGAATTTSKGTAAPAATATVQNLRTTGTPAPGNIVLAWDAYTGTPTYVVEASTNGTTFTTIGSPTGTTFTDAGGSAGQTRYYRVSVSGVSGSTSAVVTVALAAAVSAPTTAPTFTVGAATATGITLAITAQSGSDGYSLQYKRSADASYATVAVPAAGNYTVSGLTASTAYDFRLAGVNAGGTGPYSAVQQGSTTAAATTTALVTNILDGKGFTFAYGTDRLLTSHTGGAWYVRPVGATALATIGFVGDGSLDETALAAVGAEVEWMGAVSQIAGVADLLVPAGVTPPRCVVGGSIVRHPGTANRPGILWSNANHSVAIADGIDLGVDDATLLAVCAPAAPNTAAGETAVSSPVAGVRPSATAPVPPTPATFGTTDAALIQSDTNATRLRGFRGNGSGGTVLAGVAITAAGAPQVAVLDVDPAAMSFRVNGSTFNGSGVATAGYTTPTSGALTAAGRLLVGGTGAKTGGYIGHMRTIAGKKGALATADRDAIEAHFKTRVGA